MDLITQFCTAQIEKSRLQSTFDLSKPSFKHSECVFDVVKAKSKHYYTLLFGAKARLPNNSIDLQREFKITKDQLEKVFHVLSLVNFT